jgi:endoglucanase
MKDKYMKKIIIVMLMSAFYLIQNVIGANIIKDGDLESKSGWGLPTGGSWQQERSNSFFRLEQQKPGSMLMVYKVFDIPKGTEALRFSVKGRTKDIVKGSKSWFDARIITNFKDKNGDKIGSSPAISFGNKEGWQAKSVDFLVPEGATKIEIMPALFQVKSGVIDYDDFVLEPIDAKPILEKKKKEAEDRAKEAERRAALVKPQVPVALLEQMPSPIHVVSNYLENAKSEKVWLQGLSIASMEWSAGGENILKSFNEAITNWNANCIRLPIKENFWFGKGDWQRDGGAGYRQLVDDCVNLTAANGAYIVIDLHRFRAPEQIHADFWKIVAEKYKNHPAVLFEIFNEPHDISWDVLTKGGFVSTEKRSADVAQENKEKLKGFESVGLQNIIDVIRATGAKNIIIPSGLDYSYDLSGFLNGYALDDKGGNGLMYSTHVYPWKSNWQKCFVDAAAKYPLFIGEVGCQDKPMPWETEKSFESPYTWYGDMLGVIQKYKLNWTAWCFHPSAGPCVIQDWNYTPTPYWGKYVKEALYGKQFELKKMR